MAVFATRETAYLDNTASFFNSVKSGRILMMSPITYVKTEISTQNTKITVIIGDRTTYKT